MRRAPTRRGARIPEAGSAAPGVVGQPGRAWVTMMVAGMNGADRSERLRRVLALCPGVVGVEVAPERGAVTVAYDPRTVDVSVLLRLTVMVGTGGRGGVTSVSVTACGGRPWLGTPQAGSARDPVCDMWVPPARAVARVSFGGRTYYFCSKRCRTLFDQHRAWYASASG